MSLKSEAFEILKKTARPMTVAELAKAIPFSFDGTISRAMRALCAKGCVTRQPKDPAKPRGTKLWSVVPNAVFPQRRSKPAPVPQTAVPPTSSTGSSGKVITMCLPQNKPTLVTATIQAIEEMVNSKQPFSAHDITKKLRDMVKDGTARVDHTETGTVHAYGKTLARIEHGDVRDVVHEYFLTGKMVGWIREMDGDHWIYKEAMQSASIPPPVVLVVPADDYDGDPVL